jgi:hypothetical protein
MERLVTSGLRYMFDRHYWFILPEDEVIDTYFNSLGNEDALGKPANRKSFPTIPVCDRLSRVSLLVTHAVLRIGSSDTESSLPKAR